jgi:hypothetical protein
MALSDRDLPVPNELVFLIRETSYRFLSTEKVLRINQAGFFGKKRRTFFVPRLVFIFTQFYLLIAQLMAARYLKHFTFPFMSFILEFSHSCSFKI